MRRSRRPPFVLVLLPNTLSHTRALRRNPLLPTPDRRRGRQKAIDGRVQSTCSSTLPHKINNPFLGREEFPPPPPPSLELNDFPLLVVLRGLCGGGLRRGVDLALHRQRFIDDFRNLFDGRRGPLLRATVGDG